MLLLVDLDGVVYRGSAPVPGVADVLAARAAVGDSVVYVSNNSMHYRADYVTRLAGMGAPVTPDRVVGSGRATALYLAGLDGVRRVLVVGAGGLERECRDVGLDVVTAAHAASLYAREGLNSWDAAGAPHAVVVGLDLEFTYQKLIVAVDCIRRGARFIATNRDPVYPSDRGMLPGVGTIVAAVEVGAEIVPLLIGKPAPLLLEMAARAAGIPLGEAVMIGDSIPSDLAAAVAIGIPCILMLTGVSSRADVDALPAERRPVALAVDAAALAAALDAIRPTLVRPAAV
jgi:4-nitrophenyl phosphatase